ncbi:hypothetical protein TRVA0_017S01156 [Trichomonascus vanleenenianus]|uniref:uncharacterized protein n=1 Tax=Trichomonascus vanleenenianus TaxID=2268995 RepID=UPI003EC97A5D
MTLLEQYNQFRAHPSEDALGRGSNVAYIASGLTFRGGPDIVQHFSSVEHELSVKEEVLKAHECGRSLVVETDSSITFARGHGGFVPGLSMNFIADETVRVYLVHLVDFDEEGLIVGIRYLWDQATVLKQINVIGTRGNAWPIVAGDRQADQARTSCTAAPSVPASPSHPPPPTTPKRNTTTHARTQSAIRSWPDQVNLFDAASGDAMEKVPPPTKAIEPPSPSAKPPHRSLHEIMAMADAPPPHQHRHIPPQPQHQPPQPPLRDVPPQQHSKNQSQSSVFTLFGENDESSQPYVRLIGGGGGGYADSKKGLKPNWTQWTYGN